jgi:hypothetical protein
MRLVTYRYRHGLSLQTIAELEKVHVSQISRDLKWLHQQWRKDRKDGGKYVDELIVSYDEIYAAAAAERLKAGVSVFESTRCLMVMLAARLAKKNTLLDVGRIGPDKDEPPADRFSPSEIRRLAEQVRSAVDDASSLVPRGEREFLEGDIVADATPTPTDHAAG